MSEVVLTGVLSAASGVVVGALGVLGTIWQLRLRRWEMAGEVERSDATVLWQTLMEALRQQTEGQRALGERLDRLADRLERLGSQLIEIGRQWSETASRIDSLARDIQALSATQRSLEEAVRNGGRT